MKELLQKVYTFSLDKSKEFNLSSQKVKVKVNGNLKDELKLRDLFEKINTVSGNSLTGYSHLQNATLKDGNIILNGLEISLWNQDNKRLCIYEMRNPFIQFNNIQSKRTEEDLMKILKSSLKQVVTTKFPDFSKEGYKSAAFSYKGYDYLFHFSEVNEPYLFVLKDNEPILDDSIEEVTDTGYYKQYKSGFGFDFMYSKEDSKVTPL